MSLLIHRGRIRLLYYMIGIRVVEDVKKREQRKQYGED
ncbi:hypothetical protein QY97_01440 [Bacillus thermotolerans]|uniref:Uncharacterized protein n=1 Tax=Bacillus thermotolerans TaxID=1221996 RepID=A0A0F5HN72_BACTR|nr:hypothetical protein QY95_03660 [Bacillus thermotolerans]KKB35825.1 hypothetical protein QY97_01440 [Bacillus thermotolerans]